MTLREDLGPAVRALGRRPALIVVGVAIAALWTLATVVASVGTVLFAPPVVGRVLSPLVLLAVWIPVYPLLVGLFGPLAEPPAGPGATLRSAVRAIGANYLRLSSVAAVATAVAVVVALLLALLWLPTDTVVRYARYAVADPGDPFPTESLLWLVGTVVVGYTVGTVLVRFADTAVVFDDRTPRAAVAASLRFARHHPISHAGFYLLVGTIGVAGTVLGGAIPALLGIGGDGLAALLVSLPFTGLAITMIAAIQATYYRRTVGPAVDALGERRALPWRRIGLAAAVLVAAVGGAVYVRSHDVRPIDDDPDALPETPDAAFETAFENTASTNHRVAMTAYNRTVGDAELSRTTAIVDYEDRQLLLFLGDRDITLGGYFDPGVLGTYPGGTTGYERVVRDASNWTRLPSPGWGIAAGREDEVYGALPGPDADVADGEWTVTTDTAETLVLRVEDPSVVERAADEINVQGRDQALGEGSYFEVHIDRANGTLVRSDLYLATAEYGDLQYVTELTAVGAADAERPPALDEPGPVEWFWRTLYY